MNATTNVDYDSGLPTQSPYERSIVLTRTFDCPRTLMWRMWTDPVHLAQWFGPEHFTNHKVKVDLRIGGGFELAMRSPTNSDHPMRAEYREIVPDQKLAFTNSAYDDGGNQLLEGFTTVTFEDVAGKTKVTLETTAKGVAEITKFMLGGMKDGWAQSWDKLAAYLAKH